jgi:glycosyltransferase involved in cell wall biosynthesis
MSCFRLAILSTHPIQYQAPWFRALANHSALSIRVFFCHHPTPRQQGEAGFGLSFDWDTPVLEGYPHIFLKNVAKVAHTSRFCGLDTPEISNILLSGDYDAALVNGWNYKSAWQAIRSCWRTKIPVMVRSDSHLHSPRSAIKKAVKYPLYRAFIPRFDACLAVGTWAKEYYENYGARPERIFMVPHAIDEEFFEQQRLQWAPQRTELRRRWGLDENAAVFLFAGKFIEKKRPLDFVRAIELAAKWGAQIWGLMVGDGPLRELCESRVAAGKTPLRFTGFLNQSQIVCAYVAADALVLPSNGDETWGLVVNEAMMCHRPAFVSDVVGAGADLVERGTTGDIFHLGDVAGLAELMTRYAANRSKLCSMGDCARARLTRFSLVKAVEGVIEALRAVGAASQ